MNISEKIKDARTKLKLSQDEVSEKLGVTRQTLSNWETGKFLPDIVSIIKMGELYNISLDNLLKEDKSLMKKIEKDSRNVKIYKSYNIIGWLCLVFASILTIFNNNYKGNNSILQFIFNASPWILLGLGIAFLSVTLSKEKK